MEKSSTPEEKRVSAIKTLIKREGLKTQATLAGMIDVSKPGEEFTPMEPQNLSRCLVNKSVSDKLCIKIGKLFPKYNLLWLLGESDLMLVEDVKTDIIKRSDATNKACLQILDSAYREICSREGIEIQTLDNIPEILLLQGQLRDFADSLMWNYVKHRDKSHFWNTLDSELEAVERNLKE